MILVEKTTKQYRRILFITENTENLPDHVKDLKFDEIDIECESFESPIYDAVNNIVVEYKEAFSDEIENNKILQELSILDNIITRPLEDHYYFHINTKGDMTEEDIYIKTRDAIGKKKKLRSQL